MTQRERTGRAAHLPGAVVVALAVSCLVLTPGVADAAEVHTADAAAALADADLALVQLPAGASLVATSPSAQLAEPEDMPLAVTVVDHNVWWTARGSVDSVLAGVDAHRPPGFARFLAGRVDGEVTSDEYGRGGGDPSDEILLVSAIQDGDHVDVRVDAQVLWFTLKTAAETVPASIATATLGYAGPQAGLPPDDSTSPKPAHANVVLTGASMRRIAGALNALQPVSPVLNCESPGDGELGRVRLAYRGQRVVFTVEIGGCYVTVTANGHSQPLLDISQRLTNAVYAAIGVRSTPIPITPQQPPPARTAPPALSLLSGAVQAQTAAGAVLALLGARPGGARQVDSVVGLTPPPYTGPGTAVDRTYFYTVRGSVAELANWYQAHPPTGYVVAEPIPAVRGVRRLILEPLDRTRHPEGLRWISMLGQGGQVLFREDGQAAWAR
jgi:hypothetical protein